jgi:HEAT repeat protein
MAEQLAEIVLQALEREDPNLVRAACFMAGRLELAQAERGLLKALGHQAFQVQAEAARALGRIGSQGALPYLRRLLKASEGELRQKMLSAAAGKPQDEGEDEVHPEVQRAAAVAINRLNPKVTQEALEGALASGQAPLMTAAMAGLANLEAEAGREAMLEILGHDDPALRRAAGACLGKLREPRAVPRLVELLEDPDAGVRKEAVIALNHLKDSAALGPLVARLDDSDAEVRRVAAIALGNTKLRRDDLVEGLTRRLKDRAAEVRRAALSALANLKAGAALEAASELLTDSSEEVARQAGITVVVLGQARERPEYESS